MSESTPRTGRRRSERAEQLYNARALPDAGDSARFETAPAAGSAAEQRAQSRRQAYEQREQASKAAPAQPFSRSYDASLYTSNEPSVRTQPVDPAAQPAPYTPNEPEEETGEFLPVFQPEAAQPQPVYEAPAPVQPVSPFARPQVQEAPPKPVSRAEAYAASMLQKTGEFQPPVQQEQPQPVQEAPTPVQPVSPFARPAAQEAPAAGPTPTDGLSRGAAYAAHAEDEPESVPDPFSPPLTEAAPTQIYTAARSQTGQPQGAGAEAPVQEPADGPEQERSALAANLSAYYRRAANVAREEEADPFAAMGADGAGEWFAAGEDGAWEARPEDSGEPAVNVYRMQEASWAQEERETMLGGEEAAGYQVSTEDKRAPGKRRRKKRIIRRIIMLAVVLALIGTVAVLYLNSHPAEPGQPTAADAPVITPTPVPVRGYDTAPAMAVSDKTSQAIDQISGPVEMAACAVTESNVLTRSMRADGLYDYYLFASDGRLLSYFDGLTAGDMHPMQEGGFFVNMPPWLVDENGHAMVDLTGPEQSAGSPLRLRPLQQGWAQVLADDGESNFINRQGQLLSRLWLCRSFPMTGTALTAAYADTGVEGAAGRYILYLLDGRGEGAAVKWKDAADTGEVLTAALGMVCLQNGEVYSIASLLEDPAAAPLCTAGEVRFYADCNAMVLKDAATGKYALYVDGRQHYGFVCDSIRPVESDVRWQGQPLAGEACTATVYSVRGADYPLPLSYYFVLTRDGAEEYLALSAASNCPVLTD